MRLSRSILARVTLARVTLAGALALGAGLTLPVLGPAFAPALAQVMPAHQESGFSIRNAGDLATLCSAKAPDPRMAAKLNFCFGYAQGVVSSEQERAQANKPDARKFCFPTPTPSRASTMEGYAKWIQATPANANLPAADSVMKYLVERFPCKAA